MALLAMVAVLGGCALLPKSLTDKIAPTAAPVSGLRLVVMAPPELQLLLERDLDLARLQVLRGDEVIDDDEWARLAAAAPAQARGLLETEGYFDAKVTVRRRVEGSGPSALQYVTLAVAAGPRTQVTSLQVVATYAGWHYALVSPASAASSASLAGSYRLRVDARGADDHGDAPVVGTPIAVGETASGRVDLGGDIDWFRVDLQAGRRYQFELTIPASDLAIGVAPDLVLADMAGNDLYAAALGARGNAVSRFVFSPAQDGSYALRPAGVASYTLQVDAVAADDVADLAALARPLDVAVTYQALGMVVQGGDGPELFIGGSRDDQFYGDGGADILSGGPGNDLLDGGAAIDLARYPGTKVDYRLSHGAGSWAVQDLRGALGTDTLVGVERLAFEGSPTALALDLDGQAGVVAKLIGALFGPAWLARADVVGVGLAALPTMSPLELAQVAVTSDLFASEVGSHSNRDFVFAVYTHVFGRPPANADLQAYTALLDRGEYTQATLALAAADAPQNLVNIDFVGLQAGGIEYLPG